MLAQLLQALAIVQDAVAQPGAEHLLQVREALVAQRLAEAHQCGGLHLGQPGDRGDGAEGDLVRVVQREAGDLGEALGQRGGAFGDQRPEGGEITRRRGDVSHWNEYFTKVETFQSLSRRFRPRQSGSWPWLRQRAMTRPTTSESSCGPFQAVENTGSLELGRSSSARNRRRRRASGSARPRRR